MTDPRLQLKRVTPKHREIMRRLLLGQSQKEIAEYLGYSPVRVSQIVNSPRFMNIMDAFQGSIEDLFAEKLVEKEINDPVKERLENYKVDAVEVMNTLMRSSESDQVRRASAQDILDRAGYKPKEIVENTHSFSVDAETSGNINAAIKDLGISLDELEDDEEEGDWIENEPDEPTQNPEGEG